MKDSLGLWNAYHSENLHSHISWLMAMITFCPWSKLCIHLVQTLIWQMASEWSRTCLGSPSRARTTAHNSHFLFWCKFLHCTCTLPVCSQPLSPQSLGTHNFSVFFVFLASRLGPSTCLGQKYSISTYSVNKQRCRVCLSGESNSPDSGYAGRTRPY